MRLLLAIVLGLELVFSSLSSSNPSVFRVGVSVVSILGFIHYLLSEERWRMRLPFLRGYAACLVVFLGIQFVATLVRYDQGVADFLRAAYFYSYILLVFPVVVVLLRDQGERRLMGAISTLVTVASAAHLANLALLNSGRSGLLDVASGAMRFESFRVYSLPALIGLVVVYLGHRVFNGPARGRALPFFGLLTCLTAIVFVRQSRVEVIVVFVSLVIVLALGDGSPLRRFFLAVAVVGAALMAILQGGIDVLQDSFSVDGPMGFSTRARLAAIDYFWSAFLDHPLTGTGVLNAYPSDEWYAMLHGPDGILWANDVGFVGLLGTTGLLGVTLFVLGVIRMVHVARVAVKVGHGAAPLLVGLVAFVVASSPTLILFSEGTILVWPFLLGLFEYHLLRMRRGEAMVPGRSGWRRSTDARARNRVSSGVFSVSFLDVGARWAETMDGGLGDG